MVLTALQWEPPVELAAAGDIGGLALYDNLQAQSMYVAGGDLTTRVLPMPGGVLGTPGDPQTLESDSGYTALRLDHAAYGALYACWVSDGHLAVALYNYATDVSDLVAAEVSEQVDNAIKGLRLSVTGGKPELFDGPMAVVSPGAALSLDLAMGDSEWYPMGRYYVDTAPYDPLATTQSCQGRSRIGRLLRDNKFDLRGSLNQAIYTGTVPQIVTDIIIEASDGELAADDLLIQPSVATTEVKFAPDDEVLSSLTEWLQGLGEASDGGHATLAYGASGAEVTLAQRLLNNARRTGTDKLVEDGAFGALTLAAVKDYQTRKGLTVTGSVDSATWTALLGGPSEAWDLVELMDGRICVGNAAWIAQYRPVGRYTFTRGQDVLRRRIERNLDAAFAKVGVRYQVEVSGEKVDRYAYANVDTWPGWAVPKHRTHYLDAPQGASAAQAQELAQTTAAQLQFVGVVETLDGPIRPELLVGDIAQESDDGGAATVTGIMTETSHKMGREGFYTSFTTDSGGSIMEIEIDHEGEDPVMVEVTKPARRHPTGGNRKRRISDVVKATTPARRIGGYEPAGV